MEKIINSLPEKYREMAKGENGLYEVLYSLFTPFGVTPDIEEPKGLTRC